MVRDRQKGAVTAEKYPGLGEGLWAGLTMVGSEWIMCLFSIERYTNFYTKGS